MGWLDRLGEARERPFEPAVREWMTWFASSVDARVEHGSQRALDGALATMHVTWPTLGGYEVTLKVGPDVYVEGTNATVEVFLGNPDLSAFVVLNDFAASGLLLDGAVVDPTDPQAIDRFMAHNHLSRL